MIDPRDLRIGNIYRYKGTVHRVTELTNHTVDVFNYVVTGGDYVPITGKELELLGFEFDGTYWYRNSFFISYDECWVLEYDVDVWVEVTYVHELQNYCWMLAKLEL